MDLYQNAVYDDFNYLFAMSWNAHFPKINQRDMQPYPPPPPLPPPSLGRARSWVQPQAKIFRHSNKPIQGSKQNSYRVQNKTSWCQKTSIKGQNKNTDCCISSNFLVQIKELKGSLPWTTAGLVAPALLVGIHCIHAPMHIHL